MKRELSIPVFIGPGADEPKLTVLVAGEVGELAYLLLLLSETKALWHGPGEPKEQTPKEFLRRHQELE